MHTRKESSLLNSAAGGGVGVQRNTGGQIQNRNLEPIGRGEGASGRALQFFLETSKSTQEGTSRTNDSQISSHSMS